jgi:hypothetical protein
LPFFQEYLYLGTLVSLHFVFFNFGGRFFLPKANQRVGTA